MLKYGKMKNLKSLPNPPLPGEEVEKKEKIRKTFYFLKK